MDKPPISVIVVSYNSIRTIRACLSSLRRQDFSDPFEAIMVDSSTDGTGAVVREEFPEVTLIHSATRMFPGDARNTGITLARGDIICFLDSDCIARPDWLRQIRQAHSASDPVIGGSIDNAAGNSRTGWASYFTEFTHWMPGTPRGRLPEIPTCNLSFKRWILARLGPFGDGRYCEDSAYLWRLRQEGYPEPLFEPAIAVSHDGIADLKRFLKHEVFHGQSYSRLRVEIERFGIHRRIVYALAIPLIHLVLCSRAALRVYKSKHFAREFIAAFPLVFLGIMAWSIGEGIGYLLCGAVPKRAAKIAHG